MKRTSQGFMVMILALGTPLQLTKFESKIIKRQYDEDLSKQFIEVETKEV